ncbi:hypothetical protein L9F63_020658, partial [Diploptera punctata]
KRPKHTSFLVCLKKSHSGIVPSWSILVMIISGDLAGSLHNIGMANGMHECEPFNHPIKILRHISKFTIVHYITSYALRFCTILSAYNTIYISYYF